MVPKMWSGVPPEDLLMPEPALPAQFKDIWYRSRAISPERSLVLSVMWQAVLDLHKFRFAQRRQQQRLYMEAYEWVASEDRGWPFSFVNLCEMLNMHPGVTREQLLNGEIPSRLVTEAGEPEVDQAA
jgi:hypothetical protein